MAERRFGALEVLGATPETPLVVNNVVLEAVGKKRQNLELQDGSFDLKDVLQNGTGKICYGGQDAVGAIIFPIDNENKIQAVMVAADGCSFGDEVNSAEAARVAVRYNLLGWGHLLFQQGSFRSVPDMARDILSEVDKFIFKKLPNGVTTATVAVVSYESVDNRHQIFLTIAWAGDSQAMILGSDANNRPFFHKLVIPHDMLYGKIVNKLMVQDGDFTKFSQQEIIGARNAQLEYLRKLGINFVPGAISSYLGVADGARSLEISSIRINISEDYFKKGCKNLKLIVCSDNLGEKVEEDIILGEYRRTIADPKANIVLAQSLGEYMAQQNLDDGCMAIADLGRTPLSNQ